MNTLIFDTETTDLPKPTLHPAHPLQPHLIQFAAIILDKDGNELERLSTLVKPGPGAIIAHAAFRAHGISLAQAERDGMPAIEVWNWFSSRAAAADRIVGHNVGFDIHVMTSVAARTLNQVWRPACEVFCTMAHATPVVNLPPTPRMMRAGRYGPKFPTLAECMKHFFGEDLPGAHDALADVTACARLLDRLVAIQNAA